MNILKINVPDGYEIDKEKSTFEEIVFKPNARVLPKTFIGLININRSFVVSHRFNGLYSSTSVDSTENAFFQLIILRDYYNDGWMPDWNDDNAKYIIKFYNEEIRPDWYKATRCLLSFKTKELRDEFLENFKELIIQAKELL